MTLDRPAPGVVVAQPARGFRYGSDAMWLTGFALATGPAPRSALDLGTGSGVIAVLLAAHGVPTVGIDRWEGWEPLWVHTRASRTRAPFALRRAELSDPDPDRYDLVVCNPPYFAAGTGPVAPDPARRVARTESTATLAAFVQRALDALTPEGRACFVVPREREAELVDGPGAVRRWVRVGRRRALVCFGSSGPGAAAESLAETDPTVSGWVYAATHPLDNPSDRV